jgi:hypothetical protein
LKLIINNNIYSLQLKILVIFDSANQKRMNVAEITCSASNLNEEDED